MEAHDTFLDPITDVAYPVVERAPRLFSLNRWLIRHDVRGAWRIRDAFLKLGIFDVVVRYMISGSARATPILVPIYRHETSLTAREIDDYDIHIARLLKPILASSAQNWRLIDCGADIGIVTTVLLRECGEIDEVIAFEPNPRAEELLRRTLSQIGLPYTLHASAVGSKCGFGELVNPDTDDSPHAAYFEMTDTGSIPVASVDSLNVPADKAVVLKIDVEGGEFDVIAGARDLLATAPGFVIVFEAHPDVMARTGIEAGEIVRTISQICPVHTTITEYPDIVYDPDVPLAHLPQTRGQICNLMCVSKKGL